MSIVERTVLWSVSAISLGQDGNGSCDGYDGDRCLKTVQKSMLKTLIDKEKGMSEELLAIRYQIDLLLEDEIMNLYRQLQTKARISTEQSAEKK